MCGIVGLFIKNPALESELGSLVAPMLSEMTERGPDSAGIAVYRNPQKDGCKITVLAQQQDFDWGVLEDAIKSKFALKNISITRNHAVLSLDSEIDEVQDWVNERIGVTLVLLVQGQILRFLKAKVILQNLLINLILKV